MHKTKAIQSFHHCSLDLLLLPRLSIIFNRISLIGPEISIFWLKLDRPYTSQPPLCESYRGLLVLLQRQPDWQHRWYPLDATPPPYLFVLLGAFFFFPPNTLATARLPKNNYFFGFKPPPPRFCFPRPESCPSRSLRIVLPKLFIPKTPPRNKYLFNPPLFDNPLNHCFSGHRDTPPWLLLPWKACTMSIFHLTFPFQTNQSLTIPFGRIEGALPSQAMFPHPHSPSWGTATLRDPSR